MTKGRSEAADHGRQLLDLAEAARRIQQGEADAPLPSTDPADPVGQIGLALRAMARALETCYRQMDRLDEITSTINAGLMLDEVLEKVYESFRELIPYNRIGFSLIEEEGSRVRACWARTDQPEVHLEVGYSADLAGSSLQQIIETGRPRIINDLEAYARDHPHSESTRLVLAEGIRSSLTCPLINNGVPVGFIFFSSVEPNTYNAGHVAIFQRIAGELAIMLEKGRLVSELAEHKAAVERQNEELHNLNELKNDFVGMAAHDLRNPIANVQMAAHLLTTMIDQMTEAERKLFLDDIGEQARYMLELINDLLDVTMIEAGRLNLRQQPIDLHTFLSRAVHRHAALASAKDISVVLEEEASGQVQGDPVRLRQVIDNLLTNAVKYSPAGSTITVRLNRRAEGWCISVQDEGPGIKDEERALLFRYFGRASSLATGGERSTGLGLAITRRVVEAHGGEVGVHTRAGEGSCFWFSLPFAEQQE